MISTRFPKLLIKVVAYLTIFISPQNVNAQFKKAKMAKTTLSFAFQKTPSRSFIDTTGVYGEDEASIAFKTPLISKMIKGQKAGSFGFWAVLFKAGGSLKWVDFTYIKASQQLIKVNTGLNGVYYPGGKSIYLVNFNCFVAEDNFSIAKPQLMYNGSALMMRNVSKIFSYTVGASYSFAFGNGLPLPILGCGLNPGKRSRFNILLPFVISYKYRLGKSNEFSVFINPNGGMSNFSNEGLVPGHTEIIRLKQRVFRLGASCAFNLLPFIRVSPEAGINSKRKISLAEPGNSAHDSFFTTRSDAGLYFKLTVQVRFGRKVGYGANDAVNYLLDNGLNDLPDDATLN